MREWGWLDSAATLALEPAHSQHSPGLALIKGTLASKTSSPWSAGLRSADPPPPPPSFPHAGWNS